MTGHGPAYVPAGESSGTGPGVTSPNPTLKFYDMRYAANGKFGVNGQYISHYLVETLFTDPEWKLEPGRGLNLHGGVPEWQVNGTEMDTVRDWVLDITS